MASLGGAAKHAEGPLPPGTHHHLLCGTVAVFFSVGLIGGMASGRGGRWLAAVGVPTVLAAVLLAVFADGWSPEGLVLALFAVAYWPLLHDKRITRRTAAP
ncbi:hypothetical protein ACF1E9_30915 [Streptomyces roseolus]|uniref:hypothetical protein n=1 Tax=Streptomyces roseolus TaxID=67358 RepID=UPI0037002604